MADGHAVGADEDLADDCAQHALAVLDAGAVGCIAQAGQEAAEVLRELEVGGGIDELGVERVELSADSRLAFTQVGHADAELIEGQQLLLVGLDQAGDPGGGSGQVTLQPGALRGGGVGDAQLGQAPVQLVSDERGVGQQAHDVVPHERVELVGADRAGVADRAVLVTPGV